MSTYSQMSFQFHLEERWGMDECRLGEEVNTSNSEVKALVPGASNKLGE